MVRYTGCPIFLLNSSLYCSLESSLRLPGRYLSSLVLISVQTVLCGVAILYCRLSIAPSVSGGAYQHLMSLFLHALHAAQDKRHFCSIDHVIRFPFSLRNNVFINSWGVVKAVFVLHFRWWGSNTFNLWIFPFPFHFFSFFFLFLTTVYLFVESWIERKCSWSWKKRCTWMPNKQQQ